MIETYAMIFAFLVGAIGYLSVSFLISVGIYKWSVSKEVNINLKVFYVVVFAWPLAPFFINKLKEK